MNARVGRNRRSQVDWKTVVLALVCIGLVIVLGLIAAHVWESRMNAEIEDAGKQLTSHTQSLHTAQVFMNDTWYAQRNMETLLIMGLDDDGVLAETDSYNNDSQTDFLALLMRDLDTGRTSAIHINRDTMTDITTLGVTGQPTGTRYAQLALAYNYGNGDQVSSSNVVSAVEHLLYGMEVDHYITVTMDAVPIINDWAGGVTVEVLDDFTGIDDSLIQGEIIRLDGKQALTYVRTRMGLDDSTNLHRMERQRQYAADWAKGAQSKLSDTQAIADLLIQLDGYYRSDCTVEELDAFARVLGSNPSMQTYEIQGEAVKGETYMEFYPDEDALQQLILELFYVPVVQ